MKSHLLSMIVFVSAISSCRMTEQPETGSWRAALVPDSSRPALEIPFNLEIIHREGEQVTAIITNAGEEILIKEILVRDDSIHFKLPVFEGTIDARMSNKRLDGAYTHRAGGRSWTVPFYADHGTTDRFPRFTEPSAADITGRWEVSAGTKDEFEKQIGEFIQNGSRLTGTFLTTTGDYRFLEGKVSGNKMMLSAFDGAHALVFQAGLSASGNLENGIFCGGPSWKGEWHAVRNDTVSLPDPTTLTFLKPGFEKLEFTFPDLDGKPVSLSDQKYAGKPIIVQIIGSWCPNCMDETRYFAGLFDEYKDKGLEIIALCYESPDPVKSANSIRRFRDNLGAAYTFLYAGESSKRKAGESLPMLNRILSYPTSIFIDRRGKVRQIFTGFSGPGTGKYYQELTAEMRETLEGIMGD